MSTQLRRLEGCTHEMPYLPDFPVAMAAPFETCNCCGNVFYYIDSARYWIDGQGQTHASGTSHTRNLCFNCGGEYTKW